MSDQRVSDFSFKTLAEAKAFAKWFLGSSPEEIEYNGGKKWEQYLERRYARLVVQTDNLHGLQFSSPQKTSYTNQTFCKIVRKGHKPLSSEGADRKNSRFSFKDSVLFKNRAIYFGENQHCCFAEMFHLDIHKLRYPDRTPEQMADELPVPEYLLCEFKVSMNDILVLTTKPTYKALGINANVLKDEWFDLNSDFEIPSSSQILAAIVRENGFKGILYTSVRHQTFNNLVLFEENTGQLGFEKLTEMPFSPQEYLTKHTPK